MKSVFLPHYSAILDGKDTAYYLICKTIYSEWNAAMGIEELFSLHKEGQQVFYELIENGPVSYSKYQDLRQKIGKKSSFLDLKIEVAKHLLRECKFCENQCRINRENGETGYCGIDSHSYISSAFLHYGEETPIIPSGTIFFAGCTFDCVFCQNWDISRIGKVFSIPNKKGMNEKPLEEKDALEIAEYADRLEEMGAKNINYVGGDPTPNLHNILNSLKFQEKNITQLWNSNFYNSLDALDLLRETMDFWLPDLKYGNNDCAKRLSGISNYSDVLKRNLKYIYDWGSRDIVIRHLVMPNHYECCTKPIIEWISREIPDVLVNIMGQYRPQNKVNASDYPDINRRPFKEEINKAFALAERLGIKKV